MLTEIRDRSSGWFAWIIAALIIIPMAFWGVQEYASTEARPVLAEVGEQKIYQASFQAQLADRQQRAVAQNPSLANSDIFNSDFYRQSVLDNMINRALVNHIAATNNYQIGDQQLIERIKENPIFQTDGKFDSNIYQTYLNSQGQYSKKQFEDSIREDSRLSQVTSGYQESALVLPDELRELLEIQAEKRTFDLITVRQADYNDAVSVSDQDIEQYYNDNVADYMEEDRRSVQYIELDTSQIADGIEIEEAELQGAYDDYVSGFEAGETRTTRHILLSIGDDKDEDEQLAKAQELVTQLREGADFIALAKQHSDDSGTAQQGGSLGDVARDMMVPEFEKATFELEVGTISDPVKSPFGYHILQVESINSTEPDSLDMVRFELTEDLQREKAEQLVTEKADQLRNMLFEQSDTLTPAATELELEVKTTPLFTRTAGTDIATHDAVRAAAFGEQVAQEGRNSELIELADGVFVALRQNDFKPSEPKPLADVSEQIKALLLAERASAAAKAAGDNLLRKAERDWESFDNDESVEIASHTVSMVDTERKVAPDVLAEIFKMQLRDEANQVNSFTGTNGDFNIVRLRQIVPGDLAQVSQQIKDSTRRALEQRNGASLFASAINGLKQELNPKINQDLL